MADRDHASHVMSSVESMRQDDFLCDFKIKAGTETFNTHRVILAANSEYFRHLFLSNMKEVEDSCVTMPNIERIVMQQCVQYMYTSFLDLNSDSVSQILEVANYLQIERLENTCFKFLMDNLSPDNSLALLNLARTFQNVVVEEAAETIIENNVETILASKQVLAFEKKDLRRFMLFATPRTAWTAITTWSEKHEKDFPDLAELVAFTEFPFEVLINDILSDPFVKKSDKIKSRVIRAIFSDPSTLADNVDAENCFLLKQMATEKSSTETVDSFIKRNFSSLFLKSGFCSLATEDLVPLLESVEVKPEESKWDAMITWVKADAESKRKHFVDLFRCINLDKLSMEFLRETVRHEDLVKANTDCMTMLVDVLLNRAAIEDEQIDSESEGGDSSLEDLWIDLPPEGPVELSDENEVQSLESDFQEKTDDTRKVQNRAWRPLFSDEEDAEEDDVGVNFDKRSLNEPRFEESWWADKQSNKHSYLILKSPTKGFGFTISGGADKERPSSRREDHKGIYVSDVVASGPAFDRLRIGDVILKVNQISTNDWTHQQAVREIKNSGDRVLLTIRRTGLIRGGFSRGSIQRASVRTPPKYDSGRDSMCETPPVPEAHESCA